jgi:DNA-binding MarR family transcriptional regulator
MEAKPRLSNLQALVLRPQAIRLFHRLSNVGSISAREAMHDLQMTSATLARRVCDLEAVGHIIERVRRVNPTTKQRYTRYVLKPGGVDKIGRAAGIRG